MKNYVYRYLTTDYNVLEITDDLIEQINLYDPGFLVIDIYQDGDYFYNVFSWIGLSLERDGDKVKTKHSFLVQKTMVVLKDMLLESESITMEMFTRFTLFLGRKGT